MSPPVLVHYHSPSHHARQKPMIYLVAHPEWFLRHVRLYYQSPGRLRRRGHLSQRTSIVPSVGVPAKSCCFSLKVRMDSVLVFPAANQRFGHRTVFVMSRGWSISSLQCECHKLLFKFKSPIEWSSFLSQNTTMFERLRIRQTSVNSVLLRIPPI